jgi:filamentous hemagglutinin
VTIPSLTAISAAGGSTLTLRGAIDNAGFIGARSQATLAISRTVTLSGTGSISWLGSILSDGSAATLINNGNDIEGASVTIGNGDGTLNLINSAGDITTGGTLVIDTGNAVRNSATIEAGSSTGKLTIDDNVSNSGTIASLGSTPSIPGNSDLVISSDITNTGSGTVSTGPGGALVELSGGNISGGKVNIVSGATLEADGRGTSTIARATITDAGTLEAINHTIQKLSNDTINALGGTILAADPGDYGSPLAEILLSGATINWGTLEEQHDGGIRTDPGTTNTLNGTRLYTNVEVSANSALALNAVSTGVFDQIAVDANGTLNIGGLTTLDFETLSAQPGGRIRTVAGGFPSEIENSVIKAGTTVEVVAGSTLYLDGSIQNDGNIVVDKGATLTIIGPTLLTGAGTITLAGGQITSAAPAGQTYTLSDGLAGSDAYLDNTIEGYGTIGTGDGTLQILGGTLINFNANGTRPLVIDTGTDIGNVYLGFNFEATGRGGLTILDNANGNFEAQGGNITVQGTIFQGGLNDPCIISSGHQVEFKTPVNEVSALFQNNAGDSGRLILDQNSVEFQPPFAAFLEGFSGTVAGSDVVDLRDINPAQANWTYTQDTGLLAGNGALDVTDGNGLSVRLELLGQYLAAGQSASGSGTDSTLFQLSPDGQGGTLVVTGAHP